MNRTLKVILLVLIFVCFPKQVCAEEFSIQSGSYESIRKPEKDQLLFFGIQNKVKTNLFPGFAKDSYVDIVHTTFCIPIGKNTSLNLTVLRQLSNNNNGEKNHSSCDPQNGKGFQLIGVSFKIKF